MLWHVIYNKKAVRIDGFIARLDGSIDGLTNIENPDKNDYGYREFIENIDAMIMERNTYEFVKKIEPWPYHKPVFVLSTTLRPTMSVHNKITIVKSKPQEIVREVTEQGLPDLYIDGEKTIKSFLNKDLIDVLIIARIPILLGAGISLLGRTNKELTLKHIDTVIYRNGIIKSTYVRDIRPNVT
jgi:dihydrofolate reductase